MRKVLIISTTFYPDPNVAGIRMTQWCRHLPEHGWKPHVLCRYYGFEATPETLAADVHPDVSVTYLDRPQVGDMSAPAVRGGGNLRRQFGAWLSGGMATLAVPDVSIYAWRRLRPLILSHAERIKPDVVLTTSPPHSNHDAGIWLSREMRIPWVADFRDPYILDPRFRPTGLGRIRWAAHYDFKNRIYYGAHLITHAIPLQARWARLFIPGARDRIRILMNGFPNELLDDLGLAQDGTKSRRTVLVTGTIPEPEQLQLAAALAKLVRDGCDLELKLIGKRPESERQLRELLGNRLVLTGYLPHRETVRNISTADLLVNFLDGFRQNTLLLSTKLFEYLASGKPLLCINPSRSDRHLLHGRRTVTMLSCPSPDRLALEIARLLTTPAQPDVQELAEYRASSNWASRTSRLASWLTEVVEPRGLSISRLPATVPPRATTVITTRNRKDELRRALASVFQQSTPVEVLVMDDASTDGTSEMVLREFPGAKLLRSESCVGLIVQRNRAARAATTNFIFSIDDDAEFGTAEIMERTLEEFGNPRVGAVAIPHIDTLTGIIVNAPAPNDGREWCVASFTGTAYAVRRDLFLKLGGFCEGFVHQGEEGDYSVRMLAAGYTVRLGRAGVILHHESSRRSFDRMDFYGRRNDVLFAWRHAPLVWLGPHLFATTINGLRCAWQTRRLTSHFRGLMNGWMMGVNGQAVRHPVSRRVYRLFRALKKRGPLRLADIEPSLSPMLESPAICQEPAEVYSAP